MKKHLLLLYLTLFFALAQAYGQTVYVTKTGTKYHKSSCKYLKYSSISLQLTEAKKKDYTACSVCKPSSIATSNKTGIPTKATSEKNNITPSKASSTKPSPQPRATSVRCSGITKTGSRCKRMTKSANGKCFQHGG
ncbi:hypothetical protein KZP23_16630 [Echinicola marina]|uniref:hypothetical protein n=1 Tax=Echinicola marina TaxID=2859768 RepID=UPI001CF69F51|nr:hypothetical protein [Echinicola marina]UCS92316.1 hypothetical protein KZP23_16630 [Echinicola marina]